MSKNVATPTKFFFIGTLVVVAGLDILLKWLVKMGVVPVTYNHIVDISYVINKGSLFSLFAGQVAVNNIFIILSVVALFMLIFYARSERKRTLQFTLALIAGGVIGNLHDRIFMGGVIDWIDFHVWPVFNIADAAIVSGVVLTIILIMRDELLGNKHDRRARKHHRRSQKHRHQVHHMRKNKQH